MAADKAKSDKPKSKPQPQAKTVKDPKAEAKEKEKKARAEAKAEARAAEAEAAKVEAPPRAPADPRQKVMKKFEGRFLPKGPLRDRYKAIRQRWDSGDDRGGVTVDELKALLADWRASQARSTRAKAQA